MFDICKPSKQELETTMTVLNLIRDIQMEDGYQFGEFDKEVIDVITHCVLPKIIREIENSSDKWEIINRLRVSNLKSIKEFLKNVYILDIEVKQQFRELRDLLNERLEDLPEEKPKTEKELLSETIEKLTLLRDRLDCFTTEEETRTLFKSAIGKIFSTFINEEIKNSDNWKKLEAAASQDVLSSKSLRKEDTNKWTNF